MQGSSQPWPCAHEQTLPIREVQTPASQQFRPKGSTRYLLPPTESTRRINEGAFIRVRMDASHQPRRREKEALRPSPTCPQIRTNLTEDPRFTWTSLWAAIISSITYTDCAFGESKALPAWAVAFCETKDARAGRQVGVGMRMDGPRPVISP